MRSKIINLIPILILTIFSLVLFFPFFLKAKIPAPTDALVGLYHPFRDYYQTSYPQGVPYKNFLITDPVRQIIPWKKLAIDSLKQGKLPLWNSYNFSGYPLTANIQSSPFYPLNLVLLFDFVKGWGWFIFLEVFLGSIFMFLFLKSFKLNKIACLLGAISWVLSGFFVAWLEWGNVIHTALWLPLILFSLNQYFAVVPTHKFMDKEAIKWLGLLFIGLIFSFLAGHWQTFFYLCLMVAIFSLKKLTELPKNRLVVLVRLTLVGFIFLAITAPLWYEILVFIAHSAREADVINILSRPDWFLPWQNLVQLIAPDFFGNPATLNYWGIWNYGEFVSYIGIIPLFFVIYALWHFSESREIKYFFWLSLLFLCLALKTPLAKIPFVLNLPFLSTAQPSRILFLVDFCSIVLATWGLDIFLKNLRTKTIIGKRILFSGAIMAIVFIWLWILVSGVNKNFFSAEIITNLSVSKRNLIFPTFIFVFLLIGLMLLNILKKSLNKKLFDFVLYSFLVFLILFDLGRSFYKYTPFSPKDFFYPQTKIIEFLKQDRDIFRVFTTDDRIFPGNLGSYYQIQAINGYDPLYLENYAQLTAAISRNQADISTPYRFNRIIEPHNLSSPVINLLNIKYVLSLTEISSQNLSKVLQEGETRLYLNQQFLPRAFLVNDIVVADDNQEAINLLYQNNFDINKKAVITRPESQEAVLTIKPNAEVGRVEINSYELNKIKLLATADNPAILVLSEIAYPHWKVKVDGRVRPVLTVDFMLRGVYLDQGYHEIEFYYSFI